VNIGSVDLWKHSPYRFPLEEILDNITILLA